MQQFIPKNLKTQLFNLIEQNQTDELIKFIDKFPDFVHSLTAPNFWTLAMYAVRYGNHQLMRYLYEKDLLLEHPMAQYTLLYIPCLNNDLESFKILCDEFGKDINQPVNTISDNTLLKYAQKFNQHELIELLCSRGAYYILGDEKTTYFANNLQKIDDSQGIKFRSYTDDKEVPQSQILCLHQHKQLTVIHYQRFKNILLSHYLITVQKQKTNEWLQLLEQENIFKKVLEYVAPSFS